MSSIRVFIIVRSGRAHKGVSSLCSEKLFICPRVIVCVTKGYILTFHS